jgi:hypothetical protein
MDFARARASTETTLPGSPLYLWGIRATARDQLSDDLRLEISYAHDFVLRNTLLTRLAYAGDYFSFVVGPFFGVFNSPTSLIQSGLSTTVEVLVPGILSVRLRSDSSLGGRLVIPGDFVQERNELAVGFYTANVIPTVYTCAKRYTHLTASGEQTDTQTAYGIRADIFQKNVPYRISLDFAYQDTARRYAEETTVLHEFGAVVLGLRLSVDIGESVAAVVDLDSSIYTFGREFLLGETSADSFLFRLSTGFELDLSAFAD